MRLPFLEPDDPLPDPRHAPEIDGLFAAGLDLSAERLLEAYSQGLFPWFSDGEPVLWWSTDPRMVLFPREFRLHRSLRQRMRRAEREGHWRVSCDEAFEAVMRACAQAPREGQDGTWIVEPMIRAYCDLHAAGFAHSVEVWRGDALVGGLYGVAIGRAFFGESMFARETDASKAALAALVAQLQAWEFRVLDCQQQTGHLASLGARPIARRDFLALLAQAVPQPPPDWRNARLAFPTEGLAFPNEEPSAPRPAPPPGEVTTEHA